jgi:hypothetical protein
VQVRGDPLEVFPEPVLVFHVTSTLGR